jgi:hypothetical protein
VAGSFFTSLLSPVTSQTKKRRRIHVHTTSPYVSTRQHTSGDTYTRHLLKHTSAYVTIRQHTSAYARRHLHTTSPPQAYVSIRQHTSAYVSIRQHTSGGTYTRHLLNALVLKFTPKIHSPVGQGEFTVPRSVSTCTLVPVKQVLWYL